MTAGGRKISRRRFVRGAAGAALVTIVPRHVLGGPATRAPSDKLNIAAVGVGGRGAANLSGVAGENLVALCDVDQRQAAKSFKKYPKAKRYRDFRRMLDQMHKQIDAVVISTPDHTHAPAAAMAMRMGKHCYCEKPLTHSVHETRVLTKLAREKKLATQLGTQIHAGENYRRAVELFRGGAIGQVRQVEVWFPGGGGGMNRPKDTPPIPAGLDWDLWLGPAPRRPYHPCYVPKGWRNWWDFANGTLGDFGCHYMDLAFWALELRCPATIEAEGAPPHAETTAPALTVRYEFDARGKLPPVRLTWRHGSVPAMVKEQKVPKWRAAVLFVGEKGMLLANYTKRLLLPEKQFAGFQPPERTIPASAGHHREWIEACKNGGPTTCGFDYSGPLTEAVLLGNVAYRAGAKLKWDAARLKATNCPEAGRYIRRQYRRGWTL